MNDSWTFQHLADYAWLTIQYEATRRQLALQGKLLSRVEYLQTPGMIIAVTPLTLRAMINAGIPHSAVQFAPSAPPRPAAPRAIDIARN